MKARDTRSDRPDAHHEAIQRFLKSATPEDRAAAIREIMGEEVYEKVLELRKLRASRVAEVGMAGRA